VKNAIRIKTRTHKPFVVSLANIRDKNKWLEAIREQVEKSEANARVSGLLGGEDFERIIMKKKARANSTVPQKTMSAAALTAALHASPIPSRDRSASGVSVPVGFDNVPAPPPFDAPPFEAPELDAPTMEAGSSNAGAPEAKKEVKEKPPAVDLLSQIRAGGIGTLKKVTPPPPAKAGAQPVVATPGASPQQSLLATLQTSLTAYRKFVQVIQIYTLMSLFHVNQ
jgi:hypothetical protein